MTTENATVPNEQVTQTPEQEEQDFAAGFGGTAPEPTPQEPTKNEEPGQAKVQAPPAKNEGAIDPEVKKYFDQRFSSFEGRIGRVLNALDQVTNQSKAQGTPTPTQQQVATAVIDPKKFRQLKEEFPDWAEAIEERIQMERAEIAKSIPRIDEGKFREEFMTRAEYDAARAESREIAKLDYRHEGWEDTIQSPEFMEFAYQGGPTPDEFRQYVQLRDGIRDEAGRFTAPPQPGKADALFKEYGLKYPQWWGERGSLLASSRASDAAKLLDAFKKAGETPATPEVRPQQTRRLEAAVAPRGTTAPGSVTRSAEDDFAQGFASG